MLEIGFTDSGASDSDWPTLVVFWLHERFGCECSVVEYKQRVHPNGEDWDETGVLLVCGERLPFSAQIRLYESAKVCFENLAGECLSPGDRAIVHLKDGSSVPDRHPGLRWIHNDIPINADVMYRLWRSGLAYPWEMPCYDKDENLVAWDYYGTSTVDATSVLDFLSPHVRTIIRKKRAALLIQSWCYNPHTRVGKRILANDAQKMICMGIVEESWSES